MVGHRPERLVITLRRRGPHGDEGFGMVLVMGTMVLLLVVLTTISVLTLTGTKSSTGHQKFTGSLDAAEAGVDSVLTQLNANRGYSAGPDVPATAAHGWTSTAAEYAWARSTLLNLAATPANVLTTPAGQFVAIRPSSLRTIYSMGWSPSRSLGTRPRLLKADYSFAMSTPHAALLTGTDTTISGNFDVEDAAGITDSADVHSNGTLKNQASSSTVSGTISSGSVIPIPTVDPRYLYQLYAAQFANAWYDLCPDGTAHRPVIGGTPCSGPATTVPTGWSLISGTWTEGSQGPPGVYYVYKENASIATNGSTVSQTLITESSNNLACPKADGSISVTKTTVNGYLPGVVLISGNSLSMGNNSAALGGAVSAQESVNLATSSAPGVTGYVVAQNLCSGGSDSFQGTNIAYNPYGGFPAPQAVQVTAESELMN